MQPKECALLHVHSCGKKADTSDRQQRLTDGTCSRHEYANGASVAISGPRRRRSTTTSCGAADRVFLQRLPALVSARPPPPGIVLVAALARKSCDLAGGKRSGCRDGARRFRAKLGCSGDAQQDRVSRHLHFICRTVAERRGDCAAARLPVGLVDARIHLRSADTEHFKR